MKIKSRNGRVADLVRQDWHDWRGNIFDRVKAKTTEKEKGIMMINQIEDRFGITLTDKEEFKKRSLEKDIEEMKQITSRFPRPFSNDWKKPIKWKRDERGNIV